MFPMCRLTVRPAALHTRPVMCLYGDGFTNWQCNAAASRALFHNGDIAGVVAAHEVVYGKYISDEAAIEDKAAKRKEDVTPSIHTAIVTVKGMEHQNFSDIPAYTDPVCTCVWATLHNHPSSQ